MPYDSSISHTEWASPLDIASDALVMFVAFNNLLELPMEYGEYVEHFGPADRVEAAIQRFFDVPVEHIRTSRWFEYEDVEFGVSYQDAYIMLSPGGGGAWTRAIDFTQSGDMLWITVAAGGGNDEEENPRALYLLTVRLDEVGFRYLS
jgi:hypothetical protein